jgi:heme-degrading monooxygenase HmoA
MDFLARTPAGPYYAVVFSSVRAAAADDGYDAMAERMLELARGQPGFLGVESVRDADGCGITVSYWESQEAIRRWGAHAEHRLAQAGGRERWYAKYRLRVCRVEAEWGHERGV